MNQKPGKILDVLVLEEDFHKDERGYTFTFYEDSYKLPNFCLDKAITGKKGSLRGFHGDRDTWKLFTCLSGSISLVALDMRRESKTYLQMEQFTLSKKNRISILVPPGVANAHQGNSNYVLVYKWSEPYNISKQFTIRYDIYKWPHKPILSERDKTAPTLKEYLKCG
jgi:dTDP-4-dehydrorhamnose 3,5-epimerase